MSGKTYNGFTGRVEEPRPFEQPYTPPNFQAPPWAFGSMGDNVPTAPAVAEFFGVPVRWVIIAGVVVWVGSYFFKRVR